MVFHISCSRFILPWLRLKPLRGKWNRIVRALEIFGDLEGRRCGGDVEASGGGAVRHGG